jgi:hypothetical protein
LPNRLLVDLLFRVGEEAWGGLGPEEKGRQSQDDDNNNNTL